MHVRRDLTTKKSSLNGACCPLATSTQLYSLVAAIAADEIPHLHTFVVGMIDENGNESDDLKASRVAADEAGRGRRPRPRTRGRRHSFSSPGTTHGPHVFNCDLTV